MSTKPIVWTIAGSDSGGGAGIQADLHTLHALGVHGCSVISAITAQNSVAVKMVDPVLMQTFCAQIDALGVDLPPAAIKIGLLPTRLHVEVLARRLDTISAPFVIYDPVAIASTGTPMAEPNMLAAVREHLLQLQGEHGQYLLDGIEAGTAAATTLLSQLATAKTPAEVYQLIGNDFYQEEIAGQLLSMYGLGGQAPGTLTIRDAG